VIKIKMRSLKTLFYSHAKNAEENSKLIDYQHMWQSVKLKEKYKKLNHL
jgi:hypothetical protein